MPRKSGHFDSGIGAFKDHARGSYFLSPVNDNGFADDDAPKVAYPRSWGEACQMVDNAAVEIRKAESRRRSFARELTRIHAERLKTIDKMSWPLIRPMGHEPKAVHL